MTQPIPLTDRFLSLGSTRAPKTQTSDQAYIEMLWRMIRGLERRAIANPEILVQVVALGVRLHEVTNVAIYGNAERYAVDPGLGASMAECGRLLGITKQSASERRARGKAVMLARVAAAGAVTLAEVRREREHIAEARRQAEEAMPRLLEFRRRSA